MSQMGLGRSFDPELDTSANDLDEPWASRSCAADQLTSDGFKHLDLLRNCGWGEGSEWLQEESWDFLDSGVID